MQLWADKLNDEAPCIDSTGELHRFQGAEAQLQGGWNEIQPYRSEVFARVRIPGPSSSKGGTTSQCLSHGGDNGEGISPSHNTPSDHSRVEELCELPEHADKLYCSKNLTESPSLFLKSFKNGNRSSSWSVAKVAVTGQQQFGQTSANLIGLSEVSPRLVTGPELEVPRFEGRYAEEIDRFEEGLILNQGNHARPLTKHRSGDSSPEREGVCLDTAPNLGEFLQAEPTFMDYIRLASTLRTGTSTTRNTKDLS